MTPGTGKALEECHRDTTDESSEMPYYVHEPRANGV